MNYNHILIPLCILMMPFTGILGLSDGISISLILLPLIIHSSPRVDAVQKFKFLFKIFIVIVYGILINFINSTNPYPKGGHLAIIIYPIIAYILIFLKNYLRPGTLEKFLYSTLIVVTTFSVIEVITIYYFNLELIDLYNSKVPYDAKGYFNLPRARSTFPESGHLSFFSVSYLLFKHVSSARGISRKEFFLSGINVFLSFSVLGYLLYFIFLSLYSIKKGKFFLYKILFFLLSFTLIIGKLYSEILVKLTSVSYFERVSSTAIFLENISLYQIILGLGPGFYQRYDLPAPIGIPQIITLSYGILGLGLYLGLILKASARIPKYLDKLLFIGFILILHSSYGGYYYIFAWIPFIILNKSYNENLSYSII